MSRWLMHWQPLPLQHLRLRWCSLRGETILHTQLTSNCSDGSFVSLKWFLPPSIIGVNKPQCDHQLHLEWGSCLQNNWAPVCHASGALWEVRTHQEPGQGSLWRRSHLEPVNSGVWGWRLTSSLWPSHLNIGFWGTHFTAQSRSRFTRTQGVESFPRCQWSQLDAPRRELQKKGGEF